jgi:fructan beta-fructosidase
MSAPSLTRFSRMSIRARGLLVAISGLALAAAHLRADDRADLLIADFEGPTWGKWEAIGTAFGNAPARGALPDQMDVSGYEGEGLVNSFVGGDDSRGMLIGPVFTIQRKHLSFLIGGGNHPGEACINLAIGDKVLRTASGPNSQPGGSETLEWQSWDVSDLAGRDARLVIVDEKTGGWGHINIDHILQTDRPRGAGPATREIAVTQRYLHLPVKNGARETRVQVSVGDKVVDEFTIELAESEPDFWVFLDLEPYVGKTANVSVSRLPTESRGLELMAMHADVPDADGLYEERYRPQFHFSSRRGWLNDPNGLVYADGEWHLYYQHNPYGWKWGNMHWGHAVSTDLVHWQELPIAIYPYKFGDWAFSGGAVIDHINSAGFGGFGTHAIIASYTSTGRGECLARSMDRGRTFTEFEGNPVVDHVGRDPKIIWYEPGNHWVMAVYDERPSGGPKPIESIAFYSSEDMKSWTRTSLLDHYFECPEIYELAVDGSGETRWVVYAANGEYAIGTFDGKTFTPEHDGKHRFHWGNCYYASQTYSNVPAADGRRIQVAWGQTGHADMPFNQQMNFPVELTLRATPAGIRQFAVPAREIERLHEQSREITDAPLSQEPVLLGETSPGGWHLVGDLAVEETGRIAWRIGDLTITYDAAARRLTSGDLSAPLEPIDGRVQFELLVDRLSVEVFANHGAIYMPIRAQLDLGESPVPVTVSGDAARAVELHVHRLKSAWAK